MLLGLPLLSLLGQAEASLGQGLPVQPPTAPAVSPASTSTAPATAPATAPTAFALPPHLITPDLPPLNDFSPYLPQGEMIHLVLKLGQRKVYVYQGENVLESYPVAIGRPEFPTPTGEFKVFEMIVNPSWRSPWTGEVEAPGADGSLGLRWIGFANMDNGVIGFHGTPNVASIGTAASHGCVRMRNEDVIKLYEHVKVGTVVRVES